MKTFTVHLVDIGALVGTFKAKTKTEARTKSRKRLRKGYKSDRLNIEEVR
jgi:hypothetical protein